MDTEKLKQIIAQLDQRIAGMSHEPTRKALEKAKTEAEAQLKLLEPYDKMGDLSASLLDPNSEFYKNYQSYLSKTTPGIGANTLLAPLIAGGVSYAGGQNIASAKASELNRERQDKINTGVQGFALQNIGTGAGLLGQQGNLGLGISQLNEQRRQYNETQSADLWKSLGNIAGAGLGLLNPFSLFGGGSAVAGYGSTSGGASGGGF